MKQIYFILFYFVVILTGCAEKVIAYKEFSAHDKSYTVQIPTDFSLDCSFGNTMTFMRETSNSSDFAIIEITQTYDGLNSFESSLDSDGKFNYSVYKRTHNAIFARCVRGLWSAVKLGMLKDINGNQYVISLSAQNSSSLSEQIIEHIFDSMVEGIPSEVTEEKDNTSESEVDFIKYSNPYFSISYPKDWIIVAQPDEMSDVYIGAPDGSIGFTVVRFDTEYSLEDMVMEAKTNSELYEMPVTKCENIKINGLTCNRMINEYDFQGIRVKTIAYSFKKANTFYSIKFGTEKKSVDKNLDLIKEIIYTLTLK